MAKETLKGLKEIINKQQGIIDKQMQEIADLNKQIKALQEGQQGEELKAAYKTIESQEQKIKTITKLLDKARQKSVKQHNERGAGRKAIDKQLVNDIQKLINEGMTMKHISEILNVSVGTVHKYSKVK